jgi:hypothetical protein
MGHTERLYKKINSQPDAGPCLTRAALLHEIEVSPATLKRNLALPRDHMNAPIGTSCPACGSPSRSAWSRHTRRVQIASPSRRGDSRCIDAYQPAVCTRS